MRTLLVTAIILSALTITGSPQERDRLKIPDQFKWKLSDIYASEEAWRAEKEKVAADIPSMQQFRGKVTSSARTLADTLDKMYTLDKEISRLFTYATLLADEDTRDSHHQGMREEMTQLASRFGAE